MGSGESCSAILCGGNAWGKVAMRRCPRTLFVQRSNPMRLFAVILCALLTAACNQEQDVTGSTPLCPMRSYSSYNPRDMNQCVAACKACDHGNTVTCSTACTLHGAR